MVFWDVRVYSQFGAVGVVSSEDMLVKISFKSNLQHVVNEIQEIFPESARKKNDFLKNVFFQLDQYFSGRRNMFDIEIFDSNLPKFSKNVLSALIKVPYGHTVSYQELASLAGSPKAARAVGSVMSSNPFPIVVPCHRVIQANGQLGNYSGSYGPQTKQDLLDFEQSMIKQSLSVT